MADDGHEVTEEVLQRVVARLNGIVLALGPFRGGQELVETTFALAILLRDTALEANVEPHELMGFAEEASLILKKTEVPRSPPRPLVSA